MKQWNSLNQNLIDTAKNSIRNKNDDITFKLLDNYADRPELWTEFLRVYNKLI